MTDVVLGNYASAIIWLHAPINGAFMGLFLVMGFYHAVLGIQVVVEDYIHCHTSKLITLFSVRFILGILFLIGMTAIIRVQVMELVSHG